MHSSGPLVDPFVHDGALTHFTWSNPEVMLPSEGCAETGPDTAGRAGRG